MTTDVLVPLEQEGTKAVVRAWLKRVGDRVAVDDPLVELETDKVAVEVPSPVAGVLRELVIATDAEASPGAVLARISEGEETESPADVVEPVHLEQALRPFPRRLSNRGTRASFGCRHR